MLYEIIDECESTECYLSLIRKLGEVFSSIENLSRSFQQTDKSPTETDPDTTKGDGWITPSSNKIEFVLQD
jgi:hypothetical protein